jgi:hypothetical protein
MRAFTAFPRATGLSIRSRGTGRSARLTQSCRSRSGMSFFLPLLWVRGPEVGFGACGDGEPAATHASKSLSLA